MDSPEHFSHSQQEPFPESLPSPEQSPNQPFHDLLHNFAQDILRDVRASVGRSGMYGYLLDTQLHYEHQIDALLVERDRQRGGL